MNYQEIKEKLGPWMKEHDLNSPSVAEIIDDGDDDDPEYQEIENMFGTVDVCLNNQRHDSEVETVLHFVDHDVYVGWTGNYDSWNGCDYSYAEMYHCKPKKITKTIYVPVKD